METPVSRKQAEERLKYLNEQLDKIEGSHYFLDHSSDHKPHPLPVAHRLWGHNVYNLMAK